MKYQYRIITAIFFTIFLCIKPSFSPAQNLSVNDEKRRNFIKQLPKPKRIAFDDRSTNVYIVNELTNPPTSMVLIDKGLERGEWKTGDYWGNTGPSKTIAAGLFGEAATTSNAWLSGSGGWVKYRVQDDGTLLKFRWYNPYSGANQYSATSNNKEYYFERREGVGDNARTIWYVKRKTPKNYNIVIAADPQPWRLDSGDPNANSNREPWLKTNRQVATALKSHAASFYIVNGDLTEFGRPQTYQDYANVYKNMAYPVYEGLGNHDYANNVRDCTIPMSNLSKDACAVSAVKRMFKEINKYSSSLPMFRQHVTSRWSARFEKARHFITGSLSYSWDYGDIHYVQLHNYPTYTAHLSDGHTTVRITKALGWLKKDLAAADKRGKVTILNFHDARPYFGDHDSHFLHPQNAKNLAAFKSLMTSHNVKAIFVGHEHSRFYCRAQDDKVFGNIPLYTAGALFSGDYYLVNVQGKNIHVKAYNGKTGKPVLLEDLGRNGDKKSLSKSCSNL
ncbi:metallophosphoesterase [Bartonella sp. ML71XJBT]|uniref:metallophosphoesterase n=1 Tax=Bartonella sp. ML71XJBT TaxID=3019094 RepID=UPI0023624833|nr:metallophosphoesterase [Bartonella sp. ML71XJBT]